MQMEGMKKDYSISCIRFVAMNMIIICHMMQYMDYELAWWFNVGVQIFLCISGYLYGGKGVFNTLEFYKKQFKKILLDYYVLIIPICIIYYIFAREFIDIHKMFKVLIAADTLYGGGHLWFIATILICYFITPVLSELYDRGLGKGTTKLVTKTGLLIAICFVMCKCYFPYFNPAVISCYIVGFCLRRIEWEKPSKFNWKLLFYAIAILMNSIQIIHSYIISLNIISFIQDYWTDFCDYAHLALGCFIFITLKKIFEKNQFSRKCIKMLDVFDKYSYDIYLTHQFWILGPFSLMKLTTSIKLNVVLI